MTQLNIEDIRKFNEILEKQYSQPYSTSNKEKESKIVVTIPGCQWDIQLYKTYIGKLNLEILKREFDENFFNYNLMEVIRCIISAIIVDNKDTHFRDLYIHQWIKDVKILSQEGLEGEVFLAKLRSLSDFLILKVFKKEGNPIHEFLVGLLGLNQLRKEIPNFVFTYGMISCSPPYLEESTRPSYPYPLSWCHPSSLNKKYILYEYIPSIGTFNDYLMKCTLEGFLNKYLQILLSLRLAGDICKFTHYDLHGENVLLRKPPSSLTDKLFYIPYSYKDTTCYVLTDYIATIIDFGFARIEYEGEIYNRNNLMTYDEKFFPLQDAYSLLLRSLQVTRNYNHEFYKKIIKILPFFYDVDINGEIDIFRKVNYLPPDKFTNKTIDDLLIYLCDLYPLEYNKIVPLTPNKNIPILSVNLMAHKEFEGILNLQGTPEFSDIYDVYNDYLSTGEYKGDFRMEEEYEKLLDLSRSIDHYYNFLTNPEGAYEELLKHPESINAYDKSLIDKKGKRLDVLKYDEYNRASKRYNFISIQNTLSVLVKLYDSLISFIDLYHLIENLSVIYGQREYLNTFKEPLGKFHEAKRFYNDYYHHLLTNIYKHNTPLVNDFLERIDLINEDLK